MTNGFKLGCWTVRPEEGTIEGPEGAIRLEPKQMDLLVFLARRAPEVASKEEIFEQVWQGAFVADGGLKRNISHLRHALADDARSPRIIQTIPKRGYRLLLRAEPLIDDGDPSGPEELYRRGSQMLSRSPRRHLAAALRMFAEVVEANPHHAPAFAGIALGHAYLYMYFRPDDTHREQALEASERALKLDPELEQARVARGLALSLDGQHQQAEQEFKTAIALAPAFEPHFFYARACLVNGDLDKAARLYSRACDIDPTDYEAPFLLAFTWLCLERADEALGALRRAVDNVERRLDVEPDDQRALYFGAIAMLALGEHERGLDLSARSLAIDPGDPYLVYGGARFYAREGAFEEAIRCFESAAEAGVVDREWVDGFRQDVGAAGAEGPFRPD